MARRHLWVGGIAAALSWLAGPAGAQVVQAGTLSCQVEPGVGLLVGSRRSVTCSFRNAAGETEIYDGELGRLGVDIGITQLALINWDVLAPSGRQVRGALAGTYLGATAEATVGSGVGANVLVGGFNRTVTLQPVSVSGQEGLNLAAGGAELTLRLRP